MFKKFRLFTISLLLLFNQNTLAHSAQVSFMAIADIHFNPFAMCAKTTVPCPALTKLQKANSKDWQAIFEKYDTTTPQYNSDTDYPLLKSSLCELATINEKNHSQFILMLGDSLGHDFKENYVHYTNDTNPQDYQVFVAKTLEFLGNALKQASPNVSIYSVMGNNDSDQADYYVEPHGKFLQNTARVWATLINNQHNRAIFLQEFPVGGYYAITNEHQKNLRIIVLNSTLFSQLAIGKQIDQAAEEQLIWLHKQLAMAAIRRQKVLLAFHIPPGIDVYASLKKNPISAVAFWKDAYDQAFLADLNKYSNIIIGVLVGHIHSDGFQWVNTNNNTVIPISVTPSISSVFGNNPGFKVYTYNKNPLELSNFITYFYPLQNWPNQASWQQEYDFNQLYQPSCKHCVLSHGMQQLTENNLLARYYITYYAVSENSQPISKGYWSYYWCGISALTPTSYQQCINSADSS